MRSLLTAFVIIALLLAGGLAYANFVWLPQTGKPWLERTLSERSRLQIRIGRLSYRFPLGWVAEDVVINDARRHVPSVQLQYAHARVAAWPLLTERQAYFVVGARARAPFSTVCSVRGRYDWRTQVLAAHVRVPSLDLSALRLEWLRRSPLDLQRGMLFGDIDARWQPRQPLELAGTLTIGRLVADWREPRAHLEGRIRLEGRIQYDTASAQWSDYAGTITVERGICQGVIFNEVRGIEGSATIAPDVVTIHELRGHWLGLGPVQLAGTIRHWAHPEAQLECTSRLHIDENCSLALPDILKALQPQLDVALTLQWDGAIAQAAGAPLDARPLHAVAVIEQGALHVPGLAEPITAITGTLRYAADGLEIEPLTFTYARVPYAVTAQMTSLSHGPHIVGELRRPQAAVQLDADWQERRMAINRLDARWRASFVQLSGEINDPTNAAHVTLSGNGALELSDVEHWPHASQTLREWALRGTVPFTTVLNGSLANPALLSGGAQTANADLRVRQLPVHVQRAGVQWRQGRVVVQPLDVDVAQGGVSLTGEAMLPWHDGLCAGTLAAHQVHLAPVLQALIPNQARDVSGMLTMQLTIAGDHCRSQALHGAGEFAIREGRLGSLPLLDKMLWGLMGSLAERLGYPELRRAEITEVAGHWTLADGKVHTPDTLLIAQYANTPIPIALQGWIGLDQKLDLVVDPRLPTEILQRAAAIPLPLRAALHAMVSVNELGHLIGRQRILGDLQAPEYHFELALDELWTRLAKPELHRLFPPAQRPLSPTPQSATAQ